MAETLAVPLSDLLINTENPRLPLPNIGQRDAIRELAKYQKEKLVALAKDIVNFGLNPSELPIVKPLGDDLNRFLVLEGNRRLVALRALENPDLIAGAVVPSILTRIRQLSRQYQAAPIESITCVVVETEAEARHWMLVRHTQGFKGASIEPWSPDDKARYQARGASFPPHIQVLNFLEERGDLSPAERKSVPTSSVKRLIDTPEVRAKLGITVQQGDLKLLADAAQVAKALKFVVLNLASGETKVSAIYTREDRIKFAGDLPASIAVTPTISEGDAVDATRAASTQTAHRIARRAPSARPREVLIPRDCVFSVVEGRCRAIELELKKVNINKFPNAVSVMLRVFIELSADAYILRHKLPIDVDDWKVQLSTKLLAIADDLVSKKKLTKQQAMPVRKAAEKNSFLVSSVTVMNQYIHNQHLFPAPQDLRASWDSLQSFVIASWAA